MSNPRGRERATNNVMSSLFGNECSEWPFSDASLTQALEFKTQQEKTKQQFYKLECVNRSIELLKTAMAANVPGHMVTQLFQGVSQETDAGRGPSERVEEKLPKVTISPRSGESAPLNYKFPPSSSSVSMHRRTNSPARIGAAAVASLAENNQLKEEDTNELPKPLPQQRSPLQFRTHRRNLSLPVARPANLLQPDMSASYGTRKTQEPMTSVISFGSWQSYDPASHSAMRRNGSVRKHRKTRSASTTPNFGVIDLNMANQVRLPSISKEPPLLSQNGNSLNEEENEFDDQKTCSEQSSRETTPIPQVTKGPNFANNLLNS
ncbi:LAQU0S13e01222g1_1 [Lachancea quebecensis]|uniref:LAQU0S13e01222g1_1 n=1 Tax=Lachancea quebecensis TaxID=1654605 RepID=A0A0P1L379_9SACH|nr:LAQU0S13e01222g1_1 [Lachancea quebecensis]